MSSSLISSISNILAETTLANHYIRNGVSAFPESQRESDKCRIRTTAEVIFHNLHYIFKVELSTIILTVIYFDRLLNTQFQVNEDNFREYFIGCLALAIKFQEENNLPFKVWGCAKLGLYKLEIIEYEVLNYLDYNLFISKETYDVYEGNILKFCSVNIPCQSDSCSLENQKAEFEKYLINCITHKAEILLSEMKENSDNTYEEDLQVSRRDTEERNSYNYLNSLRSNNAESIKSHFSNNDKKQSNKNNIVTIKASLNNINNNSNNKFINYYDNSSNDFSNMSLYNNEHKGIKVSYNNTCYSNSTIDSDSNCSSIKSKDSNNYFANYINNHIYSETKLSNISNNSNMVYNNAFLLNNNSNINNNSIKSSLTQYMPHNNSRNIAYNFYCNNNVNTLYNRRNVQTFPTSYNKMQNCYNTNYTFLNNQSNY